MAQILGLLFSTITIATKAAYTCAEGVDCVVDCRQANCTKDNIDASLASSLSILCTGSYQTDSCYQSTIILPENIASETNITCDGAGTCYQTKVYFNGDATANPSNHHINIFCTTIRDSCNYLELHASNAGNVRYLCDGKRCNKNKLFVENVDHLQLDCIGTNSESSAIYNYGCYDSEVYANNTNTVRVECSDHYGCRSMDIWTQRANTVDIIGNPQGVFGVTLHGEYISNALNVLCVGNGTDNEGCTSLYLYIEDTPNDKLKINCFGTGCNSLFLYAPSGFFDQFLLASNIDFNGCLQCEGDPNNCKSSWFMYCYDNATKSAPFKKQSLTHKRCDVSTERECGCSNVRDILDEVYLDDISAAHCMVPTPVNNIIWCASDTDCVVDCSDAGTNCYGATVYGLDANTLTVLCNKNESDACYQTAIYAPNNELSSTVTCSAFHSCQETRIFVRYNHNIDVYCNTVDNACYDVFMEASYANTVRFVCESYCYYPTIYAQHANDVTFESYGEQDSIGGYEGCDNLKLYVDYAESISLQLYGYHACSNCQINADYANNLRAMAMGYSTFSTSTISATQLQGALEVTCIGLNRFDSACDLSQIFVQDDAVDVKDNFRLRCYGKGCYNIQLFEANGNLRNITDDNLLFNACGLCALNGDTIDGCVYSWRVGCEHSASDTFAGDISTPSCTLSYRQCGCNEVISAIANVFQSGDANCLDGVITTQSPSRAPMTNAPSSSPITTGPSSSPITAFPSSSPLTASPSSSPVTSSPVTASPSSAPVTASPSLSPVTASPSSPITASSVASTEESESLASQDLPSDTSSRRMTMVGVITGLIMMSFVS